MTSQFPSAVALIESIGVDAKLVLADSISDVGYRRLILDDDGKKQIDSDGACFSTWEPWPEQGFGRQVLAAMISDLAGRGVTTVGEEHSIDHVVLLRRSYDLEPGPDNYKLWSDAEADLSPKEFAEYQDLYARVSGNAPITKTESE